MVEEKLVNMPQVPISDVLWKDHLLIKGATDADLLNSYAGELAIEMRIYCQHRIENIRDMIVSIICRLKEIKPKKRHVVKAKKGSFVRKMKSASPLPESNQKVETAESTAPKKEEAQSCLTETDGQ
jgi:hypothetical protein